MNPMALAAVVLVGVMAINLAVMHIGETWRIRPIFFSVQAVNAALVLGILFVGVPGFNDSWIARFGLAGVFVYRFVWNHLQRRMFLTAEENESVGDERERLRLLIDDDQAPPREEEP